MAQANYVTSAICAAPPGAGATSFTNPVRTAHAAFVTAVAACPPWPIPLFADASDLVDRADHLKRVLDALSVYLTTLLDDSAQNVPGGLDLRQIDALLQDLSSEVNGTLRNAADAVSGNPA